MWEGDGLNSEQNILVSWMHLSQPIAPWLGIAIILAASRLLLAATGEYVRRCGPHAEISRKILHVGIGTILLACPWLFDRVWPVVLLAAIYVGLLIARRYFAPLQYHVAGVIYGVERQSKGEYYFPLMVAALFAGADGERLLFLIPMSLLVYADAAAALIGTHYGTAHFHTPGGRKSIEGSAAFSLTAFITALVPLLLTAERPPDKSLLIAATITVLGVVVEACSWNGLDNVAVPLSAFLILRLM